MKHAFFFILFYVFLSIGVFSQSEIEITGVHYSYYPTSNFNKKTQQAAIQEMIFFVNYGNDINSKTSLFYHIDVHKTIYDSAKNTSIVLPDFTSHTFWTFAIGMSNKLKNNWKVTNIFTGTLLDDFSSNTLNKSSYVRTFSFVKKKKTDFLNYGFGVYLSSVSGKLSVLPILSLEYIKNSRGLKLFFPKYLRFRKRINKQSYLEIQTAFLTKKLNYNNLENNNLKILSLTNSLTYNYLLCQKYKLHIGFSLPFFQNDYLSIAKTYSQFGKTGITAGFSYVVFD